MALTPLLLRPPRNNASVRLFLQLMLIRYPGLVWIKSDLPPSCRSVQLVYLAPSPTLSATTKPPSDQVRRDSQPDFICIGFTFNFSRSQRRHLRCCVPCVGTMRRASTMGCAPARAARGSSRGPCRRTPSTSAWRTRTAQWTRGGETVASSVGSRSAWLAGW